MKAAKCNSYNSDNPKMVKGYAFGGLVPRRPAPKRNEKESTKMSKPQLLGRKDMFK
jgi:hypothetical protein